MDWGYETLLSHKLRHLMDIFTDLPGSSGRNDLGRAKDSSRNFYSPILGTSHQVSGWFAKFAMH